MSERTSVHANFSLAQARHIVKDLFTPVPAIYWADFLLSTFVGMAAFGLVRIFASDYLRLKKTAGLSHYTEAAMLERLRKAGLKAERATRNIGHNRWRMTFLCRVA